MPLASIVLLFPFLASAQTVHQDTAAIERAKVIEIVEQTDTIIPGTDTTTQLQTLRAQVLSGQQTGEVITVNDDYLGLEVNDRFYYQRSVFIDNSEAYGVLYVDRRFELGVLALMFVAAVIALSGWQGVRSIGSLGGSLLAVFGVLLPGILAGYNPLLLASVVAGLVLFAAIFFTHGFNRESLVAYAGTMIAVGVTMLVALWAVALTSLSGFGADGSTTLNIATGGQIDFTLLLLAAIIVGVLGVLDDIAITQAAVVTELFTSNKVITRREVYGRALRVGREHVGALVNTLVLAYTGAALPLLLFYFHSASSLSLALNSELFATEIVRMIVGSIGLICTVPIVTVLAVYVLKDYIPKHGSRHGHSHAHGGGHGHSH